MIEYRRATSENYEAIRLFLAANGWEARVSDRERFTLMMDNADRTVIALDGERLVGFGPRPV